MFGINMDLSKLKIDFGIIEKVFIEGVVEQAELRSVSPNSIALRIFPNKLEHVEGYGTMVKVSSVIEDFEDEIIELSEVTMFDAGKKISQAFMEVFKHEILDHNESLINGIENATTKSYGQKIDYDNLELWIQVVPAPSNKWVLDMNMIYDLERLRSYSIREEFSDIQKHV
jgi:hypothetical protein